MHDTVSKVWKMVREEGPDESLAALYSQRLQDAGLSRALAEPMSAHTQILYHEAFRWIQVADRLASLDEGASAAQGFGDLHFSSRQIRILAEELIPFLERAEDNLSEKEEVTHRESGYEREVAPFSRIDSTHALRDFLTDRPGFGVALASDGVQVLADLLKVVYVGKRIKDGVPKPGDLYALVAEFELDARRHLVPVLQNDSDFMTAVARAGSAE